MITIQTLLNSAVAVYYSKQLYLFYSLYGHCSDQKRGFRAENVSQDPGSSALSVRLREAAMSSCPRLSVAWRTSSLLGRLEIRADRSFRGFRIETML